MPEQHVVPQGGPPQLEVTVPEQERLIHINLFIYVKWRGFRGIVYLDLIGNYFNFTGREFRVLCAGGPFFHPAYDLNNEFAAQAGGNSMRAAAYLRVENNLGDAFPVAQVNKNKPAKVTPPVYPPGEGDSLS
jgi:hypothetical protein